MLPGDLNKNIRILTAPAKEPCLQTIPYSIHWKDEISIMRPCMSESGLYSQGNSPKQAKFLRLPSLRVDP